jgi:hypothetical protein
MTARRRRSRLIRWITLDVGGSVQRGRKSRSIHLGMSGSGTGGFGEKGVLSFCISPRTVYVQEAELMIIVVWSSCRLLSPSQNTFVRSQRSVICLMNEKNEIETVDRGGVFNEISKTLRSANGSRNRSSPNNRAHLFSRG